MQLDLTDEQAAALLHELDQIIEYDRYPLSPRILMLKEVRAMLRRSRRASHYRQPNTTSRREAGDIGAASLKSEPGPPATLGSSTAAGVRLIVWCRDCGHQVEPDPAEQAERYGAEMTVPEWRDQLVCSKCGSREVNMVVTGSKR